ncbi:hypothetical protein HDV00_003338 [Rhizophlyctis rosea]|nr:hypothetical protein HDV00_003338 [Rhizophlyctis rosea]
MERSVNKLTSRKAKPLKPKHVHFLCQVSMERGSHISDIFRCINSRLREHNWVVVFKSLILIHILMREGGTDRVLGFLASNSAMLNMAAFRDKSGHPLGAAQAKNIRAYAMYLEEKVITYREIKYDFVRSKPEMISRFRSLPVERGLLHEVDLLQRQINALLGCSFYLDEIDNAVTLQAFRLLIGDMMALFHLLNEGVIRILGEYFEMEKRDATQALQIYKNFAIQTGKTVEFFEIARKLRHDLGLDVPVFKHAPVSLAGGLEDYLNAPDFEAQRQAYKEKKAAKARQQNATKFEEKPKAETRQPSPERNPTVTTEKQPDIIDFFSSLDEEINAFTSPSVQAQYDTTDQFGAFWAAPGGNPFGAAQQIGISPTNPFAMNQHNQQQLQQQVFDVSGQVAAMQMNLPSMLSPQASAGQLVPASAGFPLLQQQPQMGMGGPAYGGFGGQNPFGQQQQQQQLSADRRPSGEFTVENVFGNANAFGGGGGASNFGGAAANPFGAAAPSPFGNVGGGFGGGMGGASSSPQRQQTVQDAGPFAGLAQSAFQSIQTHSTGQSTPSATEAFQKPSGPAPVLDPFGASNAIPIPSSSQPQQRQQGSVSPTHPFGKGMTPFGPAEGASSSTPFGSSPQRTPGQPMGIFANAGGAAGGGGGFGAGNYVATTGMGAAGGMFAPVGGAGPSAFGQGALPMATGIGNAGGGGAGVNPFMTGGQQQQQQQQGQAGGFNPFATAGAGGLGGQGQSVSSP